mgnify:CR=1 FL=1
MCAYRQLFMIVHYEYAGICEEGYQKELSWKEKILCVNEFANREMMEFLREIEKSDLKTTVCQYPDRKVEVVNIQGISCVVKSMETRGLFLNFFRMGAGVNIWNSALNARKMGVPVLKPVAVVEKRRLNVVKTFVVYLREGEVCETVEKTAHLLEKVERLREDLRKKQITHHDFHLRNIVVLEDGSLQLIDIDKLHWYPKRSYLYLKKLEVEERRFKRELASNL